MSLGLLVGEEQATLAGNAVLAGLLARNLLTLVDWGELDVLLLDLPPGAGEPQATLLETVALDRRGRGRRHGGPHALPKAAPGDEIG